MTIQVFVDRLFLTWYSPEAIAASIPAVCVLWVLAGPINGIVTFANTFVAQYHGAGRHERIGSAVGQAVLVGLGGGLAMFAVWPVAFDIFRWSGHAPEVVEQEGIYLRTLLVSAAPMLVMNAAAGFFGGLGRTWVIFALNVVATIVNIVLDYVLIFGRWGAPELGIAGAGAATAITYIATAILSLVLLEAADADGRFGIRAVAGRRRYYAIDGELIARLFRFGGPNGLMVFVDVMAWTWFIMLVGRLGTDALAASNVAFNINMFAFGPIMGVGTATQILVGQRLGEDRPDLAARATWSALWLSATYTVVLGAAYALTPGLFLMPIRRNMDPAEYAALYPVTVVLVRFVALYALFDTGAWIFSSALRGAGDTRFVMTATLALALGVMVVPSFVAIDVLEGSIITAWWFVTGYVLALCAAFFARFQAGAWRSMRVIEPLAITDVEPSDVAPCPVATVP
jgi:MATE family multidrug resistance protein